MDNYFTKLINSVVNDCYFKNKPYVTNFLSLAEQEEVKNVCKHYKDLNLIFDGGFINSEYQKAIITPSNIPDSGIVILKIEFNPKYLKLSHRILLGNLMHLGINRDRVGDIVINEDRAYVAVSDTIVNFIMENLCEISHQPITISVTDEKITIPDDGIEKTIFLASNRLDALISASYNISRDESSKLISQEYVKLNQKIVTKAFQNLNACDIISVAHKGRIKIMSFDGNSRSGRIILKIKIYR
jgi:RNA-binding protein YlmH